MPNATVHVEDTDCHFLFYSPGGSSYSWFFPFHCHREVIATVRTDACGRFCIWIPRIPGPMSGVGSCHPSESIEVRERDADRLLTNGAFVRTA